MDAIETPGDEPGTERVAGADRIDDLAHREAWLDDGRPAVPAQGAVGAQLRHDRRRPERRHSLREPLGSGVGIHVGDERELVRAAEDDIDSGGEDADDRRRLLIGPDTSPEVDIEADRRSGVAASVERAYRRRTSRV